MKWLVNRACNSEGIGDGLSWTWSSAALVKPGQIFSLCFMQGSHLSECACVSFKDRQGLLSCHFSSLFQISGILTLCLLSDTKAVSDIIYGHDLYIKTPVKPNP